MFGFRFRLHAQLPVKALAAEFVLAKRSILPPLTDVELHDRAMRPLLQRVKRQKPAGGSDTGLGIGALALKREEFA